MTLSFYTWIFSNWTMLRSMSVTALFLIAVASFKSIFLAGFILISGSICPVFSSWVLVAGLKLIDADLWTSGETAEDDLTEIGLELEIFLFKKLPFRVIMFI